MYVMQWYYYSAASFWVMVLFVHHYSVYPFPWLLIHSSYLPSLNCMPYRSQVVMKTHKVHANPSYEEIFCLCFYDIVHNVSGLRAFLVSCASQAETVTLDR